MVGARALGPGPGPGTRGPKARLPLVFTPPPPQFGTFLEEKVETLQFIHKNAEIQPNDSSCGLLDILTVDWSVDCGGCTLLAKKLKTANMLWKSAQRNTFAAYF